MSSTARRTRSPINGSEGTRTAGIAGLVARGVLYLMLAFLAFRLAVGGTGRKVDSRGALHATAQSGFGKVVLVLLVLGFAGFALWHAFVAIRNPGGRETHERVADGVRAVVYGALALLAASFLLHHAQQGNSDQKSKDWTAHVLGWHGGRLLVGAFGAAIVIAGLVLAWRVLARGRIDTTAVLDAAPREPGALHTLGVVGNLARSGVLVLIGIFFVDAAVRYNPSDAVGLDGALRTTVGSGFGKFVVIVIALGFAVFGAYSIARAVANRPVGKPSPSTARDRETAAA